MYRPTNEPNYIARKSTIPAIIPFTHPTKVEGGDKKEDKCKGKAKFGWIRFLLFLLSVGAILAAYVLKVLPEGIIGTVAGIAGIALCAITFISGMWNLLRIKHHYFEFYDSYVIEKWGILTKHSKKTIFPKIVSVSTNKHLLNYGNVIVDVVGPIGDLNNLINISSPNVLRDFLQYHMLNEAAVENISNNPYIAATDGVFG